MSSCDLSVPGSWLFLTARESGRVAHPARPAKSTSTRKYAAIPDLPHQIVRNSHLPTLLRMWGRVGRPQSTAMNDETEQKSLPASEKKLRDARRKGQVSHSRDLVTGFTLTLMFIYLLLAGPALGDRLTYLVAAAFSAVATTLSQRRTLPGPA